MAGSEARTWGINQRRIGTATAATASPPSAAEVGSMPRWTKATAKPTWPRRKAKSPAVNARRSFGMSSTSPMAQSTSAQNIVCPTGCSRAPCPIARATKAADASGLAMNSVQRTPALDDHTIVPTPTVVVAMQT